MHNDFNSQLLAELAAAQAAGEPVVLAVIVKARGSVPRHVGAKMLVYENGRISGSIGGGEMEARVVQEAAVSLNDNQPRIVPYTFIDPERGDPGVCGGEIEVYIEPYLPPAAVFIVGCGHVGQAVADLAHWLGYQVVVTDDRTELVTPEQIPHADVYLPGDLATILTQHRVTHSTYIVVVTRNVEVDRRILPLLLDTPAPYIGVMGSRRRWTETERLLLADGVTESQLTRIHAPIGLELNAETPAEIAVSILAEVIMQRRGGDGKRMSL
ncbi:MAG: XdhC/CoxI family protein [Chloroflexota bacterium]